MKMNRKARKIASNFVCIVTALSLVFLQTPVSYATAGADEAVQAVATQAEQAKSKDAQAMQAGDAQQDEAKASSANDAAKAKGDAPKAEAGKADADGKPAADAAGDVKAGASASEAQAGGDADADAESGDPKADVAANAGKDADAKPGADAVKDDTEKDAKDASGKETADDAKASKDADAKPATQRVYTYEDKQLKVTATLDKASDISDDAELKVTAITAKSEDYNYDAYLAALNEDAGQEDAYTADNTLLYDVAFLVKDAEGKTVEVQPESGAVKVKFEFKKDQLAKRLDVQEADDVQVIHLPLKDSAKADTTAKATDIAVTDVKVEKLDADVNVEDGTLSLKAQEFSAFAVVSLASHSEVHTVKFQLEDGTAVTDFGSEKTVYVYAVMTSGTDQNQKYFHLDAVSNGQVVYGGDDAAGVPYYAFCRNNGSEHPSGIGGHKLELEIVTSKYSNSIMDREWGNGLDLNNSANVISAGGEIGNYSVKEFKDSGNDYVVVLEALPAVNVTVDFKGYDGVSAYAPQSGDLSGKYYVRVTAEADGKQYYVLKPLNLLGNSTVTLSIRDFVEADSGLYFNDGSTDTVQADKKVSYNPDTFTVTDVSLVTAASNPNNYDSAMKADRTIPNFLFVSNTEKAKGNYDIVLRKWNGTHLFVNIDYEPNLGSSFTEADNYWVRVEVKHTTGEPTYSAVKMITDGDPTTIEIDQWYNASGNLLPTEKFTGNEPEVNVQLVRGIGADAQAIVKLEQSKTTVIASGQAAKDYLVSYPAGRSKVDNEELHETDITYTVTLSKVVATDDYNFKSILGPALYYGIVCNYFDMGGHFQSTFATNTFKPNGGNFDVDLTGSAGGTILISALEGLNQINIGESHSGDLLVYMPVEEGTNPLANPRDFVTVMASDGEDVKPIVDSLISHGKAISAELLSHAPTTTATILNGIADIDTTAFDENATIYIDADDISQYFAGGKMHITKHPNQTIVFNFDATEAVVLGEYYYRYTESDMEQYSGKDGVILTDGENAGWIKSDTPIVQGDKNSALDEASKHIVYNCNSCSSVTTSSASGIVLAPQDSATVSVGGTSSGWVLTSGKFHNNSGEWHNIYGDMPSLETVNLNATKTVNGKTPSATQTFTFKVEHFDSNTKSWIELKDEDNVPFVNESGSVEVRLSQMNKGAWNIYRISEYGSYDGYTIDSNHTYYAATKCIVSNEGQDNERIVCTIPQYYATLDLDEFAPKAETLEGLSGKVAKPVFENTRDVGELAISKALKDSDDVTTLFAFEVSLKNPDGSDLVDDLTVVKAMGGTEDSTIVRSNGGVLVIELAAGQVATIKGIPAGATYTVKETKAAGERLSSEGSAGEWALDSVSIDGEKQSGLFASGAILKNDTSNVGFVNAFIDKTKGSLEITKKATIKGKDASKNNTTTSGKTFEFDVRGPGADATQVQRVSITLTDGVSSTKTVSNLEPGEYTVTEVVPGDAVNYDGVKYSDATGESKSEIFVLDGVKYRENPQTVEVTANNASRVPDVEFTNDFEGAYDATGSITLKGKKTLDGRDFREGDSWTFTLKDASGTILDTQTINPTEGRSQTFVYKTISYTFSQLEEQTDGSYSKTFIYKVSESGVVDGVTNADEQTVEVTVTDNGDGTLKAVANYGDGKTDAEFTNTFTAVAAELVVTKDFNHWGSADQFDFELSPITTNAPMPQGTVEGKKTASATNSDSDHTAEFGEIIFDKAGDYEYKIVEVKGSADGVSYSTAAHTAKVSIRWDSEQHEWTKSITYDNGQESLTVTNTFTAATAQIQVTKDFNKWDLAKDGFAFKLTPGTNNAGDGVETPMPMVEGQVQDKATAVSPSYMATFASIAFEKAGEYHYTINEVDGGIDGVKYDTSDKPVTVTVSKDPDTNALTAVVDYGNDAESLMVTNEHVSATIQLQATKSFDRWDLVEEGGFPFKLEAGDSDINGVKGTSPLPSGNAGTTANATQTAAAVFGEIAFQKAGTYEYWISEDVPAVADRIPGVEYDTTRHKVTVEVTKGDNNQLSAVATYEKDATNFAEGNGLAIKNTFTDIKAAFEVEKNFNDWGKASSFTFNLTAEGNAPMPQVADGDTVTVTKDETTGKAIGRFGEITYDKPGTYTYEIREVNGRVDGVSYDPNAHTVTVVIGRDDTTNALTKTVTYDDGPALVVTNTYSSTQAELKATKDFGDNWGKANGFTFILAPGENNAGVATPMPKDAETGKAVTEAYATSDSRTVSFGNIVFEKAGNYYYTITEHNDGADGVTYDTEPHNVLVRVSKANDATNELSAQVVYGPNSEGIGADKLTITNKYNSTSAEIKVTKDFGSNWGKADSFTFKLEPTDASYPMPGDSATATATATSNTQPANFGSIVFEKAGTYTYNITEVNDRVDGVSYDTATHQAVVVVSKEDGTNALSAVVKYDPRDSEDPSTGSSELKIQNEFHAVAVTLEAKKSFSDAGWAKADSFEFELAAGESDVNGEKGTSPMPQGATDGKLVKQVSKASDIAVFGTISYDKAGTYKYTIREVVPATKVKGVTYDETTHNVLVTVSKADTAANTLTATVEYDEGSSLTISNAYDSAEATLQVKKAFSEWGKAPSDGFAFTLTPQNGAPMPKDAQGNEMATATANATKDKSAVFGSILYEEEGEFKYTIQEVVPADKIPGVSYDTTAHEVTVTVAKNEQGKLVATPVYEGSKSSLEVENDFAAVETTLKVKKSAKNWGNATGFTFNIVPEGSAPQPGKASVKVTKETPAGDFGSISFDSTGTYTYNITEVDDGVSGVVYDSDTHTAVVKVGVGADNELKIESVSYDGVVADELTVTNNYYAEGKAEFTAKKTLAGKSLDAGAFSFELKDADGKVLQKKTNAADGSVTFDAIEYALDTETGEDGTGSYTYTISEVLPEGVTAQNPVKDGITYDTSVQTVSVEVVDNGSGKLKVTYDGADSFTGRTFANKYDATGSYTVKGKKTADAGKADLSGFEFTLTPAAGAPGQVLKATSDADGSFEFTPIEFKLDDLKQADGTYLASKTFTYTLDETTTLPGYKKDFEAKTVELTVTDNGKGALVVTSDMPEAGFAMPNKYAAEGTLTLGGTKSIDIRDIQQGETFTFSVLEKGEVVSTGTAGADGEIVFTPVKYVLDGTTDQTGEHKYTVREDTLKANGVTSSTESYTVTAAVTDNGNGTLKVVTSGNATELNFTNAYEAKGSVTFKGVKTLENAVLKAGQFEFAIYENGTKIATATNDAEGKISYPAIEYVLNGEKSDVGTHTYTVKETSGGGNGITVDSTEYTVTVEVADNGDGTLKAETSKNAAALNFKNTYDASGKETLEVKKALAAGDKWPAGKKAEFKLTAETEGAPMPKDGTTVSLEGVAETGSFGTITYPLSSAGKTYEYRISETAWPGWTKSGDIKAVVKVYPDNGTGELETHVSYEPGTFTVTNTMDRVDATVVKEWKDANDQDGIRPGSVKVQLKANGEAIETFTLDEGNGWSATKSGLPKCDDDGEEIAYTWAEANVPEGYTLTGNGAQGTVTTLTNTHNAATVNVEVAKSWQDANDQDGKRPGSITVNLLANGAKVAAKTVEAGADGTWSCAFTGLPKFEKGKAIVYGIAENAVDGYVASVDVPLTGITFDVDATGKVTLVNTHEVAKTSATVKKAWSDSEDKNKMRPTSVTVALTANGAPVDGQIATLSDANQWQATIEGLDKYAAGKEIAYSWTEQDVPEGYTVKVDTPANATVTAVTNTFTALGTLVVKKTVSGGVTEEEADGALKFVVAKVDDDGEVLGYLDENGKLVDEKVELTISDGFVTEDGGQTYTKTFTDIAVGNYTVTETNTAVEGYRFNGDHSVTETEDAVSVTEGNEAKAELTDDYTEIGNLVITKTVEGGVSEEEADGALKFEVRKLGEDGNIVGYLDKDGNLVEQAVELTIKEGGFTTEDGGKTYTKTFEGIDAGTYRVVETNAAIEGYHFDEVHSVTVVDTVVSKNDDGAAALQDFYDDGTGIPLSGQKSYTDAVGNALDMEADMFQFELTEVDDQGNPLEGEAAPSQMVGNAADGSITFDEITYTKTGTHHYQVAEVDGGKPGVTYSDKVYDITVEVADDKETGKLVASITRENLSLDFANGYKAASVQAVVKAKKAYVDSVTGTPQAIEDGQFEFVLMDADDTSIDPATYTAKAGSDGVATFEGIEFTAEMLEGAAQKTFHYTMSEVVPTTARPATGYGDAEGAWYMDGDILYDASSHDVDITVADDGTGQLQASVSYGDDALAETGPTFENKHIAAGEALKFTKYYYGGDLVDFKEFSFVLEALKPLTEADMAAGKLEPRGPSDFDAPENGEIADDGTRAFTIQTTIQAEEFHKATQADVGFPAIRFVNDGDFYYLVYEGSIDYNEEQPDDEQAIAEDSAQYVVHVAVKGGKVASTEYWLLYDGDVFEVDPGSGSDELAFYNNSTGVVDFDDSGSHGYVDDGAITSVYPRAKKLVNGETLQIAAKQFTFQLLDDEGNVLVTSTNDENGDVAFFDKDTQPGLEFDEPGVYTYQIREVVPPRAERLPGVTYDSGVTTLTVDVVRESMPNNTGNGTVYALEATTSYAGPNQPQDMSADYAIFNNLMEGIDVRVQKLAADTGEGLVGCTYALWMKTASGDVMLAEAESGDDGWMTFENADVLPGYKYYFKEVAAPSGYVVDPYRSDYFELSYDKATGEYSLVSAE